MEVLALAHRFPPSGCAGAETHLAELLAALVDAGHEVTAVLSEATGPRCQWRGVDVWPADPETRAADLVAAADVVVTHLENTPAASTLGKLNETPVAVIHHNTFAPAKEALTSDRGRVDLVVANSRWVAADLGAWFRERDALQPATIVCRPIPPTRPDTVDGPADRVTLVNLRRRDPGDQSGGQITKGGELFRRLAERLPDVGFLGVRGAYGTQQDLDGLANVEVIGPVDHHRMAAEVWSRTRLLVAPSNYESWGRAAVEAMAHGVPVLASDTPGLRESVGSGGTLCDPDDVEGWVAAVEYLYLTAPLIRSWKCKALDRAERLRRLGRDDLKRWVEAIEYLKGGAGCAT